MTEYDFSPEAVDAFIRKQQKIAHWVSDTKRQPPANPFTPGRHVMPRSTSKENNFTPLEPLKNTTRPGKHVMPRSTSKENNFSPLEPLKNPARANSHRLDSPNFTKIEERPFLVPLINQDGTVRALRKLDKQLLQAGRPRLLSNKIPTNWIGKTVLPGQIGLVNHGGFPKILTRPGRYPGFPFRNWWGRKWGGTRGLSDMVIEFNGFTMVQVSHNQAAVVSDPKNRIFVIRDCGFIAYAVDGTYDVLSVVNPTNLPSSVTDPFTKVVLGRIQEVKMTSKIRMQEMEHIVATFLDIPAYNCFVLQRGEDLELHGAGQFVITNQKVTLRGIYTRCENQIHMPRDDILTRDKVPVNLTIFLKWQLTDPLKLARLGYQTPYEALKAILEPILVDYASNRRTNDDSSVASDFLVALRTKAKDEMREAAPEYGIVLKDFAVVERRLKGTALSEHETPLPTPLSGRRGFGHHPTASVISHDSTQTSCH